MTTNESPVYQGRFAPSPTGPLHFGSLIAAVGSYLQARQQQGLWQLRIEDIDPPREVVGATESIIHTLDVYGFEWDGDIIYQSQRQDIYQAYLELLKKNELVFPCTCSRKDIARLQNNSDNHVYPGSCREQKYPTRSQHAVRIKANRGEINFSDAIQGKQHFSLPTDIGDFIVKRVDGLFSYQLAVAVDDATTGITEVVRGSDLLDSTPRQIHIQQMLGLATPRYAHLPVAINEMGQKLSKQTFAKPLDDESVTETLWQVLKVLGQSPDPELQHVSREEFWQWAIEHWQDENIPQQHSFVYRE